MTYREVTRSGFERSKVDLDRLSPLSQEEWVRAGICFASLRGLPLKTNSRKEGKICLIGLTIYLYLSISPGKAQLS